MKQVNLAGPRKEVLLTEAEIIKKLKRFAEKEEQYFMDHPFQLQNEEAAVILKMLKIDFKLKP